MFFSSSKYTKTRFPRPRWGSLQRSPRPLVGCGGGHRLPIPFPPGRLWRLDLGVCDVSMSAPKAPRVSAPTLQHKFLATPMLVVKNPSPFSAFGLDFRPFGPQTSAPSAPRCPPNYHYPPNSGRAARIHTAGVLLYNKCKGKTAKWLNRLTLRSANEDNTGGLIKKTRSSSSRLKVKVGLMYN